MTRLKLAADFEVISGRHQTNLLVVFPALKMDRGEKEENSGIGRILPPELHAMLLGVVVVSGLILGRSQLG